MRTININCFKISTKLNLQLLASYFNIQKNKNSYNHIQLNDYSISSIIKVHSSLKSLFIYNYGCVVFVNFETDEIYSAVKYLESIIGSVDYALISRFNENLKLSITDNKIISINDMPCNNKYNDDILSIACGLTSKSTALAFLEDELSTVLDEAETIVNYLQKAQLRANTKKFFSSVSNLARFQHSAIRPLGLFESTFAYKRNTNSKDFYTLLKQYYETDERTNVLESKISEVNKLITSYTTLSYNSQEMSLLIFECVLLSLFLLPHLLN